MAVWLVRHGEALGATERRFGDLGLSPRGREQARALGQRLLDLPLRAALVSPLRRAGETARLILEGREIPTELEPALAEGAIGDLDGLKLADALARHPQAFRHGHGVVERLASTGFTAPGGEARDAFLARAELARRRVEAELAAGGEILVVSHGGLLNYMLQLLLGLPVRDEVPFGFANCGLVALVRHGEGDGYGPFPVLRFGHGVIDAAEPHSD